MRRWVIIFLVLINLVFFYWQYQQTQRQVQSDQSLLTVPAGTKSLVLLSEGGSQLAARKDKTPKPVANMPVDEDKLSSDDLIARFKAGRLAGQGGAVAQKNVVVAEPEAKEVAAAAQEVESKLCWQMGPFTDEISAKQIEFRLSEAQTKFHRYREDVAKPSLWWVYLPPLADRNQALALLRRLQSKKIDSFLVTKGEHKNAISLGFFSKASTAEQQLALHKENGYQARVQERKRYQKANWFVVQPNKDGSWLKLEQSLYAINPELKKLKKTCKNVALAKSFN